MSSGGGEVNAAMDFGDWLFATRLNIRVIDRCLSSCANYLFPAAPVKVIETGAIVAWHGSANRDPALSEHQISAVVDQALAAQAAGADPPKRDAMIADALDYLAAAKRRQHDFFARIGVDERVTTVGEARDDVTDFWFMSVASMAQYGITNVVAPSRYIDTDTTRFLPTKIQYLDPRPDMPP